MLTATAEIDEADLHRVLPHELVVRDSTSALAVKAAVSQRRR
jgi:hypothetical protein